MILQLGGQDLVATADCVIERLEDENIELTGQGAPEILATLGCDPSTSAGLFAAPTLEPEDALCVTTETGAWLSSQPLSQAEELLGAQRPPQALFDSVAETCGVTQDQLDEVFGG